MSRSRHPRGRPHNRAAITRNISPPSLPATRRVSISRKRKLSKRTPRSFEERATKLLKQYQDSLRKLARHEVLNSGDMTRVFRAISEACCSLLPVERASIWLFPEERSVIKLIDVCTSRRQHSNPTFMFQSTRWRAYLRSPAHQSRAIAVYRASRNSRFMELAPSYLSRFQIEAMLSAPIRQHGRLVGALCAESVGTPRRWSRFEQYLVSLLATTATLALEAARTA